MESYNIWTIAFLLFVALYSWNTNKEWRKELKNIDEISSCEAQNLRLLRLLISIAGAIFICLTFIFAFLAIALYELGSFI